MNEHHKNITRIEGLNKLSGKEQYVDDIVIENCLWGAIVRSPVPRGKIKNINFDNNIDWSQFIIVDHHDIPGHNEIAMIENDQPVLAANYVRHIHEPIILLAHKSRKVVNQAVKAIEIIIEPDPPCLDYRVKPQPAQIQHKSDNIFTNLKIEKGNVERALKAAAHIIEGTYETGAQEHIYLETQGMLSWVDKNDDTLIIKGSMQCPYYVLSALTHALNLSPNQIRVIQTPTGGAFGGKEDYPSHIALHTALLAMQADNNPVKIIYDRPQDMAVTTKRHPATIKHRTALDSNGKLIAQEIDVKLDAGAYATLSPVVLSRAIIHAAGPYHCENVKITGRAVFTNAVPFSAFRGFGAPQTHFANERHMDVIAEHLNIDPITIRKINLIKDGQTTSTGQIIKDNVDCGALLDHALEISQYNRKILQNIQFNQEHPYLKRGVGISTFHHGAGFTGSGEVDLKSQITIRALPDGKIEVLTSNTEMGQGAKTIFTQIVAANLNNYSTDNIIIAEADTSRVPDSGPTVASRTSMIVGYLLQQACADLKQKLNLNTSSNPTTNRNDIKQAIINWYNNIKSSPPATTSPPELTASTQYQLPPDIKWNDQTYTGDAYGTYAWAAYIAEVEVDMRTFATSVIGFTAVQDIGKVLNDTLARGQIQGGVVQAIGWALSEQCHWQNGALTNSQLTNYIIPTSCDVPEIKVDFRESPYTFGPNGAKGIGELPMDGPAPAIANAIANATNANPTTLPITPEKLMNLLISENQI